ncbi:hypothetical protein X743_31290 [Mesorhizobium sp. LNHC252B00]|uniref:ATP-dependent DNA ligase n=1 Tax=Mesorhizobium sp. LNHC252B00 TaxID=1287252 RepID=UPI0003CE2129|nr:hypothetical protein [Mesorhizobium sp. LNHC252B00]ESY64354.1 hypothetical protein X743_31290 [Mesorhizobium sp. LNHC252B00]
MFNEAGLSDFGELRKQHDLSFVAFDLVHLNGHDLRDMALEERREILVSMIEPGGSIQFSEPLPGDAKAIYHLPSRPASRAWCRSGATANTGAGRRGTWAAGVQRKVSQS